MTLFICCLFFYVQKISKMFSQNIKGPLSGLKQFLATDNLLKKIQDAFYFILKALFILEVFLFALVLVLSQLNFCLHFLVM